LAFLVGGFAAAATASGFLAIAALTLRFAAAGVFLASGARRRGVAATTSAGGPGDGASANAPDTRVFRLLALGAAGSFGFSFVDLVLATYPSPCHEKRRNCERLNASGIPVAEL
jgi:hypothetical protein